MHKCPYLQNSIQERCWNTELSKVVVVLMLKHGSCYIVWGCICWNTKLLHSLRSHMPKHGAATCWNTVQDADAETRSCHSVHKLNCWNIEETATMLKHEPQQLAVKDRHSQGRNSRGWNSPWIAMLKQHQQLCKESVTPAVTTMPCSAPVLAFGCMRIGHPRLI